MERWRSIIIAGLAVSLARFSPAFALKHAAVRLSGVGLDRQERFAAAYGRHFERSRAWNREASIRTFLSQSHPAKYGASKWDISDMPRFAYQETWPGEEARLALVEMGILAIWGLTFLLGAYVAMRRYDPR